MAAVAGTTAVAGTLGHAPRQRMSTVALRMSSSRAFVPAQFGVRFRGRVQLQSCHCRRSVFVAQNSAQTEAKVRVS